MNRWRLLFGGVGLALVGAVVLADGALASLVALDPVVAALGNDYFLAVALGLLVVVGAILVLSRSGSVDQRAMPDVEESVSMPAPGEDVDETVTSRWVALPVVGTSRREAVQDRLRDAAVAALTRSGSLPESDARQLVATGEWTDDAVAAGFLASDRRGPGWADALANAETPVAMGARRSVDAIAAVAARGPAT
ncbi:hypothetical protein ACKVMT_07260 [Halobacteriales archaeon Cl-PHB]